MAASANRRTPTPELLRCNAKVIRPRCGVSVRDVIRRPTRMWRAASHLSGAPSRRRRVNATSNSQVTTTQARENQNSVCGAGKSSDPTTQESSKARSDTFSHAGFTRLSRALQDKHRLLRVRHIHRPPSQPQIGQWCIVLSEAVVKTGGHFVTGIESG